MAPLINASKAHSSPSVTLTHQGTPANLLNDARLIPRPLSTRASRANLSSDALQLGKYISHVASPKEYSQKVVRSYSLGLRPKTQRSQEEREAFYTCTLCFYPLPPKTKPYVLPSSSAASGTVATPLKPPPWTEDRTGIELVAPPICDYCVDDWKIAEDVASPSKSLRPGTKEKLRVRTEDLNSTSSDILHQMRRAGDVDCHTSTPKCGPTMSKKRSRPVDKFPSEINLPKRQKNPRLEDISEKGISSCDRLITRPTHVSIFKPLELDQSFSPIHPRPLPKWMSQLPSSRVKDSVFRKSSSPVCLPSQQEDLGKDDSVVSVKPTKDFVVRLQRTSPSNKVSPVCYSPTQEVVESERCIQRAHSVPARSILPQKPLAAFPFFQNPRAPLTPAVESSWGSAPSSGMTPYNGLPPATEKKTPSPKGGREEVLQSNEYNEKYSVQMPRNDNQSDKTCPICEETITNSADDDGIEWCRKLPLQDLTGELVMGLNDLVYHITCIQCRACRQPFRPKDSMTDWTWVGSSSPYHRTCMVQGAKPMLERLRRRLSMAGLTTGHPSKQDPNSQMLPGLSRPAPHVVQQIKPASDIMPTFKKPDYLRSLPSLFSTRAGPEPVGWALKGKALNGMLMAGGGS
ncbi:hypothetical protein MMC18_000136 [Xylographa bjoerkii]|nr:hypothetical protein [Xylographa bjoerkii]